MGSAKYENGQSGTHPSQMYGWTGTGPVRLLADGSGNIYTVDNRGMFIPRHDEQVIDESSAPATTTITYKLLTVTVAVKTITVSGTTATIAMTYV
jgi:hypothetical protein